VVSIQDEQSSKPEVSVNGDEEELILEGLCWPGGSDRKGREEVRGGN
jgi:hypothetical protein